MNPDYDTTLPGVIDPVADPSCEVFFSDEAGFEGDPRPSQKWVKRGTRPVHGYHGGHLRRNVIGAANPSSGKIVSLIVP